MQTNLLTGYGTFPTAGALSVSPLARNVIRVGLVGALAAGIPLIAQGVQMFLKQFESGSDGWRAWVYLGKIGSTCDAHLGAPAFEQLAGLDAILQGVKYVAIPASYALTQLSKVPQCLQGRTAAAMLGFAGLKVLGETVGAYGTTLSVKNGVKDVPDESFVDTGINPETQQCEAIISDAAKSVFSFAIVRGLSQVCEGIAIALGLSLLMRRAPVATSQV